MEFIYHIEEIVKKGMTISILLPSGDFTPKYNKHFQPLTKMLKKHLKKGKNIVFEGIRAEEMSIITYQIKQANERIKISI